MLRQARCRIVIVSLALALDLLLAATPALAKNGSGVVKTTITLAGPANLAGTALKPGEYTVIADGSKVTLKQDGRVVGEAPVQWADAKEKFDSNGVVTDGDTIREIRFSGKTKYVVIR